MDESSLSKDDLLEQRYGVRPSDPAEIGDNMVHLTCDNFDKEVLSAETPVVVDFWAEWCAPCRILAPTFKELAKEYAGQMVFGKMDTEECREVSSSMRIMSIPTMVFFYKGETVDVAVGALSKDQLKGKIEGVLAKAGVN